MEFLAARTRKKRPAKHHAKKHHVKRAPKKPAPKKASTVVKPAPKPTPTPQADAQALAQSEPGALDAHPVSVGPVEPRSVDVPVHAGPDTHRRAGQQHPRQRLAHQRPDRDHS